MAHKKHLTLKIFFFLCLLDCFEAAAQFCYKKTALTNIESQSLSLSTIVPFILDAMKSPFLWMGLLFVALIFVIWSTVISKIDLSVAVPATSFNFVTVPFVSIIFLHEQVSLLRWMGIAVILVGVMIVSLSSKEKSEIL